MLQEQITWAANLVLVILGYVGIMLAISTLRKINSQMKYVESVAVAAVDVAQAALQNTQAIVRSERPWILVSVESSLSAPNSFTIVATNRGRSPAKIVSVVEQIKIVVDEAQLAQIPEYDNDKPGASQVPVILLPGEFIRIKSFSRDDLKTVCPSGEILRRVENWEEKIFIYGKILYKDLITPRDKEAHVTDWCSWYIHGRQRSGLVIGGPSEYNLHT